MKERIKEIRKALGLTLEQFGEPVGVSKSAMSRLESGTNNLTEQMIKSICREFNVSEEWLRTGEGEMFIPLDIEEQLMDWAGKVLGGHDSTFKKRFVAMLMGLSEPEWQLLEEKARELVEPEKKKGV